MTEEGASLLAALFGKLKCKKLFSCNQGLDEHVGIALWFMLMLYMFKALGTICDEYFVPSLEVIVDKLQVSNDVAGATFMAAGSSAPELFTSLVATFIVPNAAGVGTIVGSAIFNILVMNGITAFVACKDKDLKIWWYPLARDTTFYTLAIVELVVVLWDEEVRWYEGCIMIATYLAYCFYMKFNPQTIELLGLKNPSQEREAGSKHVASDGWWDPADDSAGGAPKSICPEDPEPVGKRNNPSTENGERRHWSYRESQNGSKESSKRRSQAVSPAEEPEVPATDGPGTGGTGDSPENSPADQPAASPADDRQERCPYCKDPLDLLWEVTLPPPERGSGFSLFTMSILWIGLCTYVMVDATNRIGIIIRMPSFVMGLIFLAAGTSIPDTLGSIAVAKQGQGDMAIANALGSNVFDILIGLGVPWTIRAINSPVEFKGQFGDLIGDIVILVVVLVLFVGALAINSWKLNRRIGAILILFYLAFVIYQVLAVFVFKWKQISDSD